MKDTIKQKIVEKAKSMLFRTNDEKITMNLIAEELGITAPTLYHYFKGKNELLAESSALIANDILALVSLKFPPSIPAEMKIVTATGMVAEYFMKTGVPAYYLVEDPQDKTISLTAFREKFVEMFADYLKKSNLDLTPEQATYRHLSIMQADVIYYRNVNKELEDDFAEKVFSALFK